MALLSQDTPVTPYMRLPISTAIFTTFAISVVIFVTSAISAIFAIPKISAISALRTY